MKLSVARGELLDALSVASKGMSARSTLPILSGILVSAEERIFSCKPLILRSPCEGLVPRLSRGKGRQSFPESC